MLAASLGDLLLDLVDDGVDHAVVAARGDHEVIADVGELGQVDDANVLGTPLNSAVVGGLRAGTPVATSTPARGPPEAEPGRRQCGRMRGGGKPRGVIEQLGHQSYRTWKTFLKIRARSARLGVVL